MSGMDVAVLGGGPAGLAAALALRQRGFHVGVYDAQHPPIDKACGEGLMPDSIRILEELGVALRPEDGARIAGISFRDSTRVARCDFRGGRGFGMRRTRLHARLAARALEAGIALHWGVPVQAGSGRFVADRRPISADFFVIADGLCSTLARAAGFPEPRSASTRYAFRQPFRCTPWSDTVEVHWGRREQIYVTPIGADEVNVALLTGRRGRRLTDALAEFPAVAQHLVNAARTAPARGAVTRTRTLRPVVRGNMALLGDASGSVDAITGEGLLSAFRQALALAEALCAGELARYAQAHRSIARNPARMARLLLLLDRHPQLRRHAIAALAAWPECFAELLSVHLGEHGLLRAVCSLAADALGGHSAYVVGEQSRERGL